MCLKSSTSTIDLKSCNSIIDWAVSLSDGSFGLSLLAIIGALAEIILARNPFAVHMMMRCGIDSSGNQKTVELTAFQNVQLLVILLPFVYRIILSDPLHDAVVIAFFFWCSKFAVSLSNFICRSCCYYENLIYHFMARWVQMVRDQSEKFRLILHSRFLLICAIPCQLLRSFDRDLLGTRA